MRLIVLPSKLDVLRSKAGWLAQNRSGASDLGIFQRETLPTITKGCPSVAGFDALEQATEKRRSAAYEKVRLALADRRSAWFVMGLGGLRLGAGATTSRP